MKNLTSTKESLKFYDSRKQETNFKHVNLSNHSYDETLDLSNVSLRKHIKSIDSHRKSDYRSITLKNNDNISQKEYIMSKLKNGRESSVGNLRQNKFNDSKNRSKIGVVSPRDTGRSSKRCLSNDN